MKLQHRNILYIRAEWTFSFCPKIPCSFCPDYGPINFCKVILFYTIIKMFIAKYYSVVRRNILPLQAKVAFWQPQDPNSITYTKSGSTMPEWSCGGQMLNPKCTWLFLCYSQQLWQKIFVYNATNPQLLVSRGHPKGSYQMAAQLKNFRKMWCYLLLSEGSSMPSMQP